MTKKEAPKRRLNKQPQPRGVPVFKLPKAGMPLMKKNKAPSRRALDSQKLKPAISETGWPPKMEARPNMSPVINASTKAGTPTDAHHQARPICFADTGMARSTWRTSVGVPALVLALITG